MRHQQLALTGVGGVLRTGDRGTDSARAPWPGQSWPARPLSARRKGQIAVDQLLLQGDGGRADHQLAARFGHHTAGHEWAGLARRWASTTTMLSPLRWHRIALARLAAGKRLGNAGSIAAGRRADESPAGFCRWLGNGDGTHLLASVGIGAIVAQRPECRAGQGDSNCCPWRTPAVLRRLLLRPMMLPDTADPHDLSLPILYQDSIWWRCTSLPACWCTAGPSTARKPACPPETVRNQLGRHVFWRLHRLDKGTSGILLFALSRGRAHRLAGV